MKKHLLQLLACLCILFSCTKNDPEPPEPAKDLYPQLSQAMTGKWYLRQSLLEEYRYDGLGKVQYFGYVVGNNVFLELTGEIWENTPGTYRVLDQTTGLARPNYGGGIIITERWKVFHPDSLQIGPNRVKIKYRSADSIALEGGGPLDATRGWLKVWEFEN